MIKMNKQNKGLKKIMWILMILLLLYGCKKGGKYTPTITSKDIYTGRDGLVMEFFDGAPPEEVFENGVLPIGIRLYNKGAHDIEEGYLSIMLEKKYMMADTNSLKSINQEVKFKDTEHITFELEGKGVVHPKGGQEVITFTASTKELDKELYTSLVSIIACYDYQTRAVETICIDTDVYGLKEREKSCDAKKTLTLSSQGAPVAVTKIESDMLPDKDNPSIIKPRFEITIKDLGNGRVIGKEYVEAECSSGPVEYNLINVKAYISTMDENNKLDCDNEGSLTLKRKEGSLVCVYEEGFNEDKGTYSSPLYIIMDYGYADSISRDVKIKNIVT